MNDMQSHHSSRLGGRQLKVILCSRDKPALFGKPCAMTSILEEMGHQVTEVQNGPLKLSADDVVWIQDNTHWCPSIVQQLCAMSWSERPFVILWHTDPLPPPKAMGLPRPRLHLREIAKIILRDKRATDVYTNYHVLRRLAKERLPDALVVSAGERLDFLAERGIAAHWVPLGYYPSLGHDLDLERDIDVLFLGSLDVPRRNHLLENLRRRGLRLLAKGGWSDPMYWGENRTRLLNRTKFLLNFARTPGEFSGLRLILGMANKALVISEPIHNPAPYVPGRHFIMVPANDMPDVINHYLAHDDEREQIANEGHRFVTQELTMARSVSQILELIKERVP